MKCGAFEKGLEAGRRAMEKAMDQFSITELNSISNASGQMFREKWRRGSFSCTVTIRGKAQIRFSFRAKVPRRYRLAFEFGFFHGDVGAAGKFCLGVAATN